MKKIFSLIENFNINLNFCGNKIGGDKRIEIVNGNQIKSMLSYQDNLKRKLKVKQNKKLF